MVFRVDEEDFVTLVLYFLFFGYVVCCDKALSSISNDDNPIGVFVLSLFYRVTIMDIMFSFLEVRE